MGVEAPNLLVTLDPKLDSDVGCRLSVERPVTHWFQIANLKLMAQFHIPKIYSIKLIILAHNTYKLKLMALTPAIKHRKNSFSIYKWCSNYNLHIEAISQLSHLWDGKVPNVNRVLLPCILWNRSVGIHRLKCWSAYPPLNYHSSKKKSSITINIFNSYVEVSVSSWRATRLPPFSSSILNHGDFPAETPSSYYP